jgi:hypothetical protein
MTYPNPADRFVIVLSQAPPIVSYRKRGGLRFVKIGRLGFSFWVSR